MKRFSMILLFAALSVPMWAASGKLTTSSTGCASTVNCLVVSLPQDKGGATLTISGTWTGTITFEVTGDGGVSWTAALAMPVGDTTAVTSTTAVGMWQINLSGCTGVRMRASATMSGTAAVTITPSAAAFAR